ncbi:MAG TPA: MMPL family transporter [Phycisphaerae bacterium]|nr:MMPL family transporter [Phycisphaerae bacterium]
MGFVQRRLVKMVMKVVCWPKTTVAVCAVLLVASVLFAKLHLSLSTDQNALLTPNLKFFKDYLRYDSQFPENESFVVIVEPRDYVHPPPAKRWMALADRISANLRALTNDVARVDERVPLDQLGDQALEFDSWDDIRTASAGMQDFSQLLKVVAQRPGLDSLVLGGNMTQRLYNALAAAPTVTSDTQRFAALITRTLNAAVHTPIPQWQRGAQTPDMNELDPRAATDPEIWGYNMIRDETKRAIPDQKNDKILVINVHQKRDFSSLADVTQPLQRMRAAVADAAQGFDDFWPPVITGRPALEADEMATSDHDTKMAEICGLLLVFGALWVFLRHVWLVIIAEACLGVGIGWTFGWATLSIGRLNLLSLVFVIALIGIGMDYLIQILTRYRFEKKRYARPQAIWARVFRYVSPPISTACAGAAGAFLVSALTQFKGAAELGVIAGGGLLLCLAAGYTLLPALLTLFPAEVGTVTERYHDPETAAGGERWRLIFPAIWVIVAVGGLWYSLPPTFDPNLLRLQAQALPSVQSVHKLPTWFAAVTTQNLDDLREARADLTPRPGEESTIEQTESILDAMDKQAWLAQHNAALKQIAWYNPPPPDPGNLRNIAAAARKLIVQWEKKGAPGMADLRRDVEALAAALDNTKDAHELCNRVSAWQQAFFTELQRQTALFTPGPLDIARLPASLREHYVSTIAPSAAPRSERDVLEATAPAGHPTYALYVYPKADLWDAGALQDFVKEVESRTPKDVVLTGIAPQLYHSVQEIHRAFKNSTEYALILVFVLVLLDLRKLGQTLLAVSVLGLGLPMLLLCMWLWRYWHEPWGIPGSWNFANFFGLPILIGAGHEYGVFMVHRYRETLHDPRRVWRRWDVSDRALLLCAIVTSFSFGFLILAKHRGLASLGWVMAVGTACIYLSTVFVLRPILQWRLHRKGVYQPPRAEAEEPPGE